jgi:peptidoglycan/LPS O-acetylase OafA/YrhL
MPASVSALNVLPQAAERVIPVEPGHLAQLDGLRAIAVAAVAWFHFMPLRNYGIPLGPLGVQLFFVLSGFLITGILLDARYASENIWEKRFAWRQFYCRRFLRIFPLFYMALAIGVVFDLPAVRETWLWHATYTSNFHCFLNRAWDGHAGHFWSLAVEEQFYLFWPLVILFLPRKHLLPVMLSAIVFAPICRLGVPLFYADDDFAHCLTPACFDSLGIGALLAYGVRNPKVCHPGRTAVILLAIGIAGCALTFGFKLMPKLGQTFAACFFGWLVYSAARGFTGLFGSFLQAGPMSFLGRISYGLYVLHMFAFDALDFAIKHLHLPAAVSNHGVLRAPILAAITIMAASISWYLYEKPLNDLKRFFPYASKKRSAPATVPAPA